MEMYAINDTSTFVTKIPTELKAPLLDYDEGKYILTILMCGVTPLISLIGFTGNVFSIKILRRDGLHKCSNILLVSLAFADTCFLIGFNSFPKNIYVIAGDGSFQYSKFVSHAFYTLYLFFLFFDYCMGYVGLTIPMLITCERLVAVFLPLKFTTIVTPRRVWTLIACVYMFWVTLIGYTIFWFEFSYSFDARFNRSVGYIKRSQLFHDDRPNFKVLEKLTFSQLIAPVFTFFGCLVIIARLKYLSHKRKKMTHKPSDKVNVKTTQMLLAVCAIYLLACLAIDLPLYLPEEYVAYNLTSDDPTILGLITYQLINIVLCINSSWNFIIYVALNKKFRDIFKEILVGCCSRNSK